ncbi:hypothetical protein [Serratia liquefaciens]|uniref:hypothetical protein n=1 Tax=Serratia liquefaciens TaxID=614 RepID=UPI002362C6AA|nr:hypothetical protein [Serratia liquefaciens]
MGTTIFVVLLVCGYWYATRDGNSRLRLKRKSGWEVYFLVALYGSVFVFQGINIVVIFWLLLFSISSAVNLISATNGTVTHSHLYSDFMNLTFFHEQAPVLLMFFISLLLCLFHTTISTNKRLSNNTRTHFYQELTKGDGIGYMLFNSMKINAMVSITLVSGRRYIGIIYASINETTSHGNLIILPLLEKRDGPGVLGFTVERNYCPLYEKMAMVNGNLLSNELLKLRLVVMSHQVESLAYFHLGTLDSERSMIE